MAQGSTTSRPVPLPLAQGGTGAVTAALARDNLVLPTNNCRNLIIGGNFDTNPWQRGTSFAAAANTTYQADRFSIGFSAATATTVTKTADAPTVAQCGMLVNNCIQYDVTTADASVAAGDYTFMRYVIEGYDWAQIAQRSFTISFWHKHTKTGTYCVGLENSGQDRSYVFEYTQDVADTWELATHTVAASPGAGTWLYTNGIGLYMFFIGMCGSTYHTTANAWQTGTYLATSNQVNAYDSTANFMRFALIQVEAGNVATPFQVRSEAQELSLCQRYYNRISGVVFFGTGYTYTTAKAYIYYQFPVSMRTSPAIDSTTLSLYSILYDAGISSVVTALALSNSTAYTTLFDATGTATPFTVGRGAMLYSNNASGYIGLTAEF